MAISMPISTLGSDYECFLLYNYDANNNGILLSFCLPLKHHCKLDTMFELVKLSATVALRHLLTIDASTMYNKCIM